MRHVFDLLNAWRHMEQGHGNVCRCQRLELACQRLVLWDGLPTRD